MKKGISLLVMVITIIIVIILAGIVVVGLTENNPITKAKIAVFQDALSQYKEDLKLYKTNNLGKEIEDVAGEKIKKYIPSIKEEDMTKVAIENEKLIYIGGKSDERKWAAKIDVLTSRNSAPVLIGEVESNKSKNYLTYLANNGQSTNNIYIKEIEMTKEEELTYKMVKYNDRFKKEWEIESIDGDTINYQGKYIYVTSNESLYKIEDKTGEIINKVDLKARCSLSKIVIDNAIKIYTYAGETKFEVITLDKDTLEKIDSKKLELPVDSDVKLINTEKDYYLKWYLQDYDCVNPQEDEGKFYIFKISDDKIDWEFKLDSFVADDKRIIEYEEDLIISGYDIKKQKFLTYYVDKRSGKVKETLDTKCKVSEIYSKDIKNNMLATCHKEEEKYLCKLDSNLSEIWSLDLNANLVTETKLIMSEKDNMMIVINIEREEKPDEEEEGTTHLNYSITNISKYLFE